MALSFTLFVATLLWVTSGFEASSSRGAFVQEEGILNSEKRVEFLHGDRNLRESKLEDASLENNGRIFSDSAVQAPQLAEAAGALGDPSKGFLQNDVAKQSGSLLQGLGEGSEAKQSDKPLGFYFRRDAAEQAQADSSGSTAADMLRGGAQAAHRKNQASSSPAKNALGHYFSGEAGAQAAEAKGSTITPSKIKMARGQQWDAFRPRPLDKSKLPFETVR